MPGYVDAFSRLRRRRPGLHRLVPWKSLADPDRGLMTTKDDGFLCCARVTPPDLGSLSDDEQWAVTRRLNAAAMLLTPGSGLWHDLRNRPEPALPARAWSNPISQLLDEEHRARLNASGACWRPVLYLSFYHRPPPPATASGLTRYFMRDSVTHGPRYGVEAFAAQSDEFFTQLSAVCPTLERLTGPELLTYLHSCVSIHEHPLWEEDLALDLDTLCSDCGLWRGMPPMIGDASRRQYVRSLCLYRQFSQGTAPALFADLYHLPFAWRAVTRWLPKSRTQAQQRTDKLQVNWLSRQKGWRASWYEARTGHSPNIPNTFLARQATDVDLARDHVLAGEYDLGKVTLTFVVHDEVGLVGERYSPEDMARVNGWMSQIAHVIRRAGCTITDDPINQMENFVATWPGAAYANLDALEMTSLNFATLALTHQPWRGLEVNRHLQSPPLLYALTEGCQRVGVDTFVGDFGDATLFGPRGSGKSTALAFMDAMWLTDPSRQLAHFDLGGSCECLIRCVGGQYHDLAREVSLQVMADLDHPYAVNWIFGWLKRRVQAANVPDHPDIDTFLWGGLDGPDSLKAQRQRPRTLSEYLYLRQLHANKIAGLAAAHGTERMRGLAVLTPLILGALRPFAQGGVYGHLTDAPVDRLQLGRVHGFELENLLTLTDAYSAVLEIIWYRLKARRDGSLTRYVFDEARHVLNRPEWLPILKDDIPSQRREQASGLYATQAIAQIKDSPLYPLLGQTRFFLPDPSALDGDADDPTSNRHAYLGMGLGVQEIQRNIVMATPTAHLYWTMPDDRLGRTQRRLIELRLGPLGRAICGANTPLDRAAMRDILATHHADEFAIHWLRRQGFPEAAEEVARWLDAA